MGKGDRASSKPSSAASSDVCYFAVLVTSRVQGWFGVLKDVIHSFCGWSPFYFFSCKDIRRAVAASQGDKGSLQSQMLLTPVSCTFWAGRGGKDLSLAKEAWDKLACYWQRVSGKWLFTLLHVPWSFSVHYKSFFAISRDVFTFPLAVNLPEARS